MHRSNMIWWRISCFLYISACNSAYVEQRNAAIFTHAITEQFTVSFRSSRRRYYFHGIDGILDKEFLVKPLTYHAFDKWTREGYDNNRLNRSDNSYYWILKIYFAYVFSYFLIWSLHFSKPTTFLVNQKVYLVEIIKIIVKNIVFQHHYTQCIVLYSSLRVKQNESTLSHDCKDHNFLWSKKSMHIDKNSSRMSWTMLVT